MLATDGLDGRKIVWRRNTNTFALDTLHRQHGDVSPGQGRLQRLEIAIGNHRGVEQIAEPLAELVVAHHRQ